MLRSAAMAIGRRVLDSRAQWPFAFHRSLLGSLLDELFFSLDPLNERIWELMDELNDRPMRLYKKSRRELYETIDRPALKPLPVERFTYAAWTTATVNIDFHVAFDGNLYSVPYALVKARVDVRATATTVEVFFKNQRVASHARRFGEGVFSTQKAHMPRRAPATPLDAPSDRPRPARGERRTPQADGCSGSAGRADALGAG